MTGPISRLQSGSISFLQSAGSHDEMEGIAMARNEIRLMEAAMALAEELNSPALRTACASVDQLLRNNQN